MSFHPVASTGSAAAKPWQFTPETYNAAAGDGRTTGDVTTNGTLTVSSPTIAADPNAVGKLIMIHGANGSTQPPYLGAIASVSGNNVTLTAGNGTPSGSVANCPAVWGTESGTAINTALTAMGTYATTHGATSGSGGYQAELLLNRIYLTALTPTQTSSPTVQNSQLVVPFPNANGTTPTMSIGITGPGNNGKPQYWESLIPNVKNGSIVSLQTAPTTPSGTFGNQSVLGGPSGSTGLTGGYANVEVTVKGVAVWCPIYTSMYAFDFGYINSMTMQQSAAHIFAPTGVNGSAVPPYLNGISATLFTNSIGSGVRTPTTGNNDASYIQDCTLEGYECALRFFDHLVASPIRIIYSDVVCKFDSSQGVGGGTSHGVIMDISAEAYNGGLLTSGGTMQVDINWDAECASVTYDVSDVSNALHGVFRFRDPADTRFPTITTAAGSTLKVICDELGPGYWSHSNATLAAPAVPASTTPQQNTSWRDALLTITSGGAAVTAITVDGQASGATLGTSGSVTVPVPAGKNIALTYASTAPTWIWYLL